MAGRRPTPRHATRRPTPRSGAAPRGGERFARWYRVVPVVVLVMVLAVVAVVVALPTSLGRALHPVRHADQIEVSCERHGVDPLLACAVIECESGWDEGAVSPVGAVGLMQVMPDTARSLVSLGLVDDDAYDPDDLADPATNIEYGCAYLGYLQEHLSGLEEVIAAYNAGIGAVQGWISEGGTIPEDVEYAETRAYLDRVLAAYEAYQDSYPSGITGV